MKGVWRVNIEQGLSWQPRLRSSNEFGVWEKAWAKGNDCDSGALSCSFPSGENLELSKLNTFEIRDESFGVSRWCSVWKGADLQVKRMSIERSSFSEAPRLSQAARTLGFILLCLCHVGHRGTGALQGALCSRGFLRAVFVGGLWLDQSVRERCKVREHRRTAICQGGMGEVGRSCMLPQVWYWEMAQQWECDFHIDGKVGGCGQEECKRPSAMLQTIRMKTSKIVSASNVFD